MPPLFLENRKKYINRCIYLKYLKLFCYLSLVSTTSTTSVSYTTTTPTCTCPENTVPCGDCTKCVHIEMLCNNNPECPDGSDELDCPCTDEKTGKKYQVCGTALVICVYCT